MTAQRVSYRENLRESDVALLSKQPLWHAALLCLSKIQCFDRNPRECLKGLWCIERRVVIPTSAEVGVRETADFVQHSYSFVHSKYKTIQVGTELVCNIKCIFSITFHRYTIMYVRIMYSNELTINQGCKEVR